MKADNNDNNIVEITLRNFQLPAIRERKVHETYRNPHLDIPLPVCCHPDNQHGSGHQRRESHRLSNRDLRQGQDADSSDSRVLRHAGHLHALEAQKVARAHHNTANAAGDNKPCRIRSTAMKLRRVILLLCTIATTLCADDPIEVWQQWTNQDGSIIGGWGLQGDQKWVGVTYLLTPEEIESNRFAFAQRPFSNANIGEVCGVVVYGTSSVQIANFSSNAASDVAAQISATMRDNALDELNRLYGSGALTGQAAIDAMATGMWDSASAAVETKLGPWSSNASVIIRGMTTAPTLYISTNDFNTNFAFSNAFLSFSYNPLTNTDFIPLLGWLRHILTWVLTGIYIWAIWDAVEEKINFATLTPQASASGQSVMGTNINLGAALIAGGIIVGILVAIPTAFTIWIQPLFSKMLTNVLNYELAGGNPAWLNAGISLVAEFFPIDYGFQLLASYFATRLILIKLQIWVASGIRMITG